MSFTDWYRQHNPQEEYEFIIDDDDLVFGREEDDDIAHPERFSAPPVFTSAGDSARHELQELQRLAKEYNELVNTLAGVVRRDPQPALLHSKVEELQESIEKLEFYRQKS